jgi:PP-loop superfamily ATP-utilizing enzyme
MEIKENGVVNSNGRIQERENFYFISEGSLNTKNSILEYITHKNSDSYDITYLSTKLKGSFLFVYVEKISNKIQVYTDKLGTISCYRMSFGGSIYITDSLELMVKEISRKRYSISLNKKIISDFIDKGDFAIKNNTETFINEILKFPPNTITKIDKQDVVFENYWESKPPKIENNEDCKNILVNELIEKIEQNIKLNLKNDSTLLISDGVDSALIGAIAIKKCGLRVNAITSDFENNSINNLNLVHQFCDEFGLNLELINAKGNLFKFGFQTFDSCIFPSDSLFMSGIQNQYLQTKKFKVTTIFGGYGADEIFNPDTSEENVASELEIRRSSCLSSENEFSLKKLQVRKVDPIWDAEIIDFVEENNQLIKRYFGTGKELLRSALKKMVPYSIYHSRVSDIKEKVELWEEHCIASQIHELKKKIEINELEITFEKGILKKFYNYDLKNSTIEENLNRDELLSVLRYLMIQMWIFDINKKWKVELIK